MENEEKRARKWSNKDMFEYADLITKVPHMLLKVDIMDLIYLSEMYQDFANWMKRVSAGSGNLNKWDYIFEERIKPLFPHAITRVGDNPRINCLAWYFVWNNFVKLQDSMFFHDRAIFNFFQRGSEPVTLTIFRWKDKEQGELHFWTADRNVRYHVATDLELLRLERININRETMNWTVDNVQDFYQHTATVIYMVMDAGWFLSVQQHRQGEPPFQSFVRQQVKE